MFTSVFSRDFGKREKFDNFPPNQDVFLDIIEGIYRFRVVLLILALFSHNFVSFCTVGSRGLYST